MSHNPIGRCYISNESASSSTVSNAGLSLSLLDSRYLNMQTKETLENDLDINNKKLLNIGTPQALTDAVNKDYVDKAIALLETAMNNKMKKYMTSLILPKFLSITVKAEKDKLLELMKFPADKQLSSGKIIPLNFLGRISIMVSNTIHWSYFIPVKDNNDLSISIHLGEDGIHFTYEGNHTGIQDININFYYLESETKLANV